MDQSGMSGPELGLAKCVCLCECVEAGPEYLQSDRE